MPKGSCLVEHFNCLFRKNKQLKKKKDYQVSVNDVYMFGYLVSSNISFQQCMLFLQVLNTGQVFSVVI